MSLPALRSSAPALAVGFAAVLALPLDARAQRGGQAQNRAMAEGQTLLRHLAGGVDALADSLSLAEGQARRVARLAAGFRNDNADALERFSALREEMREAMAGRDRAAIAEARRRWSEKYGNPARDLAPALAALRDGIDEVLDEAQREKLAEMLARNARRRQGG